jgi:L-rhamnonate dehydratase
MLFYTVKTPKPLQKAVGRTGVCGLRNREKNMKITNVRVCQPIAANSPPDWRTSLGQILVAIDTDVGLVGYGVGGGGQAGMHVIRTVLRDLLLGKDAEPVESLWEAMYQATLPFGRKGLAIMALSGVDLALWDLRGKAAGQPIAELLGGKIGQKIPTYVTVWDDIPETLLDQHQAFKIHVGGLGTDNDVEQVVATMTRARKKVGPDCTLMIDAWMKWTLPFTLEVAQALTPLRLDWIEEPLSPDDLAGYEKLVQSCPVPIAGGEHEFTALGFGELIERRLHHVVQPDVCWCGGMTELVKIYRMARDAGLRVCPHRGAEQWGLHALAALDPDPLAESGRPWMTWVGGQPAIENGFISLPDAVGFGVQIDEGLACFSG